MKDVYAVPCIYPVCPKSGTLKVSVPGSKSITNRALLLATLSEGTSVLRGALFSDDSRHFLKCVQDLGFGTSVDEVAKVITVTGQGGRIPCKEASLYVGSAGTAARFLTALLGVSEGCFHMDASAQMRRRPMKPLLTALESLGCEVTYEGEIGFFPFTLTGHGFVGGDITVDIGDSSQFLSALLIAACLGKKDVTIHVEGSHGMSYIHITRIMMEQFGVKAIQTQDAKPISTCTEKHSTVPAQTQTASPTSRQTVFQVKAGQHYRATDYQIEPDVSAACYFFACCPLLEVPIMVRDVHLTSMQGDIAFLRILEQMGCTLADQEEGILVSPPAEGHFSGVDVDMSACSDQAITLAAIAPFADTPTTIRGIGHIRYQESNRMAAIVNELHKMGIRCTETETTLTIFPGKPAPCTVETYEDHRMAMGFALTGLRAPGIVIKDPGCCRKTFEDYFAVLDSIIATVTIKE